MTYTSTIIIHRNLNEIIKLLDEPENLYEWMPGLVNLEAITGTPGQVGSTMRMNFKDKGRKFSMVEEVLVNDLPRVYKASYVSGNIKSVVTASMEEMKPNITLYRTHSEFKFSGMMAIVGAVGKRVFKKQSMRYLLGLKAYAERVIPIME